MIDIYVFVYKTLFKQICNLILKKDEKTQPQTVDLNSRHKNMKIACLSLKHVCVYRCRVWIYNLSGGARTVFCIPRERERDGY